MLKRHEKGGKSQGFIEGQGGLTGKKLDEQGKNIILGGNWWLGNDKQN